MTTSQQNTLRRLLETEEFILMLVEICGKEAARHTSLLNRAIEDGNVMKIGLARGSQKVWNDELLSTLRRRAEQVKSTERNHD